MDTLEHRRFVEFCDACRRYRYIGLCYGVSGVGKTISARTYSLWEKVREASRWTADPDSNPLCTTVLYTPPVVNAPGRIDSDIRRSREMLTALARRPIRREKEEKLKAIRQRDEKHGREVLWKHNWPNEPVPRLEPSYGEVSKAYSEKELQVEDPTTLILIDEADRLRMASLEQTRDIFDAGEIGLILIGMPGLEKRLARYSQFYSRIGFVHEFRPLAAEEVRRLLDQRWTPPGVRLPDQSWESESVASVIRITGGNFRLLNRLLTQVERILEVNGMDQITKAAVEAARKSLVIGEV